MTLKMKHSLDDCFEDYDEDETVDTTEPQDNPSSVAIYAEEPGTSSSNNKSVYTKFYLFLCDYTY